MAGGTPPHPCGGAARIPYPCTTFEPAGSVAPGWRGAPVNIGTRLIRLWDGLQAAPDAPATPALFAKRHHQIGGVGGNSIEMGKRPHFLRQREQGFHFFHAQHQLVQHGQTPGPGPCWRATRRHRRWLVWRSSVPRVYLW